VKGHTVSEGALRRPSQVCRSDRKHQQACCDSAGRAPSLTHRALESWSEFGQDTKERARIKTVKCRALRGKNGGRQGR
jgi:hypothetical protein